MNEHKSQPLTSLKELDPVEDLLARLRLDREARRAGVAIVEGPSDERVLSSVLKLDRRSFFPAAGRSNLLRCANALRTDPLNGVICVGDRDFDKAASEWSDSWFFVFYDGADVEAMIVDSPALDRVLEEWASKRKLERLGGPERVRELLKVRAKPLSRLRAASAKEELGLAFDKVPLPDIIEKRTAEVRMSALLSRLSTPRSSRSSLSHLAENGNPPVCGDTGKPLARGRDLLTFLAAMLRQLIGNLSKQQIQEGFMERTLRLALRPGDFDGTPFQQRFLEAMQKATGA